MDNTLSAMAVDRIRVLRSAAREAVEEFKKVVSDVGNPEYISTSDDDFRHDNVRVVEADQDNFVFRLDSTKHQVVVILAGEWTLEYGHASRDLEITDTIKIPINENMDSLMRSKKTGAKFVYVQFKY